MEAHGDANSSLRLDQLAIPDFFARDDNRARREREDCRMVGLSRPKLISADEFGCIFHGVGRILMCRNVASDSGVDF